MEDEMRKILEVPEKKTITTNKDKNTIMFGSSKLVWNDKTCTFMMV